MPLPYLRSLALRLVALAMLSLGLAMPARAFDTTATHAWVYDMTTHTVLLDKNGDIPVPPASMSKLMTIDLLFEALQDGRVTMDTTFPVSAHATSFTALGGSSMYLQQGDRPTVAELLRGMIVNSGNDACTVVAEGLQGTEAEFAKQMNARAKQLGLTESHFANASGWPNPGQLMSMHDLGMLAVHIIKTYPQYYHLFSIQNYDYKNRVPDNAHNRNPLLEMNIGADGLKTGHTEQSGYGLVGSAVRNGRRIVFAFNGVKIHADRATEGERITNWAFRQFALKTVVKKGTPVTKANVFLGTSGQVPLVPAQDVKVLVPVMSAKTLKADASFKGPILAPIAKGEKLGQLTIHIPGLADAHVALVAGNAVARGGFTTRLQAAAQELLDKYLGGGLRPSIPAPGNGA